MDILQCLLQHKFNCKRKKISNISKQFFSNESFAKPISVNSSNYDLSWSNAIASEMYLACTRSIASNLKPRNKANKRNGAKVSIFPFPTLTSKSNFELFSQSFGILNLSVSRFQFTSRFDKAGFSTPTRRCCIWFASIHDKWFLQICIAVPVEGQSSCWKGRTWKHCVYVEASKESLRYGVLYTFLLCI